MAIINFGIKWCFGCNTLKSLDSFSRRKGSKDGKGHECRVCLSLRAKSYYKNNIAAAIARANAWAKKHPELGPARSRAHRLKNYAHCLAVEKAWREANPANCAERTRRYRAKKKGATGTFTREQVDELFKRQRGLCAVCRKSVHDQFHLDHIKPLAGGGDNTIGNIQILCPKCNHSKGAKDPIVFMQLKGYLL
jgi:5-methylcytosine-specific restriction endonuclease McrA